jgi:hypothetical protein
LLQKPNVRPLKGPDQKDFPTKGTLNKKVISLAVLHKFDALNRNSHVLPSLSFACCDEIMHRDKMRRFDGMFCAVRTPADEFGNMLSGLTEEQHDLCRAIRYVVFFKYQHQGLHGQFLSSNYFVLLKKNRIAYFLFFAFYRGFYYVYLCTVDSKKFLIFLLQIFLLYNPCGFLFKVCE